MNTQELRLAILHRIIDKSEDVGKVQLQKLCYFLQEALDVPMGYSFRMYHYGPYADSLETDMSRLKLTGYIDIERDSQGYGFHITKSDDPMQEWNDQIEPYKGKIDDVIENLGSRPAYELELAATIHFVKNLLPASSTDEVVSKVEALKPKFSDDRIRDLQSELRDLGLID